MRRLDKTDMGGLRSTFTATRWSQMHAFTGLSPDQQKAVLDELTARYWRPVYSYLRRKGCDNEQAKDLTQGFFHEVVIGRQLIEQADESKGRFRTFLLTALDRYVISAHRHEAAAKRRPTKGTTPLDDTSDAISLPDACLGPEEAFTYAWALDLLKEVLAQVERQCADDGKEVHWQLFRLRVLEPILTGQEPPSLGRLCDRFSLPAPVKAENMIVTVKRRFQTAMRDRVSQYVRSDEEVEQEIRDLMAILSR
ncbi:MAG: sigma-70 family RNA polymerase sigma factor [Sedimentisphaerales bacterium]|nr:sigma-70 family RNA polymerase sigma factor [Sedimentisphaerales bacterium]